MLQALAELCGGREVLELAQACLVEAPEEVHRVANERLMQMMPQVLPAPDAMGPPAPVPAPATGITDAPPPPKLSSGGQ